MKRKKPTPNTPRPLDLAQLSRTIGGQHVDNPGQTPMKDPVENPSNTPL